MADVKWIKIVTDVFDDEKMLLIESLPSADSIIVIWFKLLCLAGKNNNNGVFIMNDKIPYTDEMLATIFRRDVNTVRLALKTFECYGMIEIINGVYTIPNWGKHQNLDKIEQRNEYMKNYMKEYREKQKKKIENPKLCQNGLPLDEWHEVLKYFNHECAYCGEKTGLEQEHIIPASKGGEYKIGNIIPACRKCNSSKGMRDLDIWYENSDFYSEKRMKKIQKYIYKTNVSDLRKANVSEADIDLYNKELEIESDKDIITVSKDTVCQTDIKKIMEKWNDLERFGIKPIVRLKNGSKRYDSLIARIKEYGIESVELAIDNIKESDYCQGKNKYGWAITFDWFVLPNNFIKVLEGNYSNRTGLVGNGRSNKATRLYDDRITATKKPDQGEDGGQDEYLF